MHCAIIGASALGLAYGGRLAVLAQQKVTIVSRFELPASIVLRRYGTNNTVEWVAPQRASTLPPGCDLALLAVPYERVHHAAKHLVATSVPVLVLTPLLPLDLAELNALLGRPVHVAMPGILASYAREAAVVEHIMPKAAPTLFDARDLAPPIENLERTLLRAGIPTEHGARVHAMVAATLLAATPWTLALDRAGTIERILADARLLKTTLQAFGEARTLAERVGQLAPWVTPILPFVNPLTLRLGLEVARNRWPSALAWLETHYGRRLHAQHRALAPRILELGRRHGTSTQALAALFRSLT